MVQFVNITNKDLTKTQISKISYLKWDLFSDPGVGPALEYSSLPSIVNLSCSVRQVKAKLCEISDDNHYDIFGDDDDDYDIGGVEIFHRSFLSPV